MSLEQCSIIQVENQINSSKSRITTHVQLMKHIRDWLLRPRTCTSSRTLICEGGEQQYNLQINDEATPASCTPDDPMTVDKATVSHPAFDDKVFL